MIRTIEATIDETGQVRLLEDVHVQGTKRALLTILDSNDAATIPETALLSESALAEDWNRPEEDEAWAYLQREP